MKSKLLTLAAVGAAFLSTSAMALPVIGFDPLGTGANFIYADTWNYATDRGVDVGNQNFVPGFPLGTTSPNVGDEHRFHTQMVINSFQINGQAGTPTGMNGFGTGWEITKQAVLVDNVTSVSTDGSSTTVQFAGGANPNGLLNIYLDYYNNTTDLSKANGGSGASNVSCYGDSVSCGTPSTDQTNVGGTEIGGPILTARQISASSSFTASTPGTGTGSFQVLWEITSYNPLYIDLSNLGGEMIFADLMDGTLTQPATQTPGQMWDGTTPGDPNSPLFDITGRQVFKAVPEPSSIALLSAGLLLTGFFSRKKA